MQRQSIAGSRARLALPPPPLPPPLPPCVRSPHRSLLQGGSIGDNVCIALNDGDPPCTPNPPANPICPPFTTPSPAPPAR